MADSVKQGILRDDATAAIVAVSPEQAVPPLTSRNDWGWVTDATGAVLVVPRQGAE